MKTNKIIISALVSLMAAGVMAHTSEKKLNEINIDSKYVPYEGKSFYTADVDSIVFYKAPAWNYDPSGESHKKIMLFGNGRWVRRPEFPVSEITSIQFATRDSRKLYAPKFTDGRVVGYEENPYSNTLAVAWEPVEGAVGYELKYCHRPHPQSAVGTVDFWGNGEFELWLEGRHPENIFIPELPADGGTLTLAADQTEATIAGLQYGTQYQFAVRAMSADGEEFNSDWSIREGLTRYVNFNVMTEQRYPVPQIIYCMSRNETSVRIGFDLSYDTHKNEDFNPEYFEIVDGKFVADELRVKSSSYNGGNLDAKWANYKLTAEDIANGYIDVTGLDEASSYLFTIVNTNISSSPDAKYNTIIVSTKGTSAPILIPHVADAVTGEYEACDITSILQDFNIQERYDSQIYYLEGDKAYYLSSIVSLRKGITLETLPEDAAAGKRAIVYMGGITGAQSACNFMLGYTGSDGLLAIEPITFRNIDFDCPEANNFPSGAATGNYFLNTYSAHEPFVIEALNIEGCTFRHFIRGFLRIQGDATAKIKSVNFDGNLFYNCGYYDNNGRGYAWFAMPGRIAANIYTDFRFVNNTIYDSPRTCLITDNGANLDWTTDDKWNIVIENNTFINFSTRNSGTNLINLRYVPGGSHFSVQRNLFALVRCSADDQRSLNQGGVDIRTINGSGEFTFEVKDNYSTGCLDQHLMDDGIFTSGAFSAKKNSFGTFEYANMGTQEDLVVKVGSSPLRTDELFVNPNPPYNQIGGVNSLNDHTAPDNILEALKYKQTPEVLNHEIYTKNIGDPRWRN